MTDLDGMPVDIAETQLRDAGLCERCGNDDCACDCDHMVSPEYLRALEVFEETLSTLERAPPRTK